MGLNNSRDRDHSHSKIDQTRKNLVAMALHNSRISTGIISLIVSLATVAPPAAAKNKCPADQTGGASIPDYIERQGLTDLNGKQILPARYASITYAGNGLFTVREKFPPIGRNNKSSYKDKTFVINRDGTRIAAAVPPGSTLTNIRYFGKKAEISHLASPHSLQDDAMIVFSKDQNLGICDKRGKVILPASYGWIGLESEGKMVLRDTTGKLFVFDVVNEKITPLLCNDEGQGASMYFTEGLAVVHDRGPKFITPTGENPIKIRFSQAGNFVNGRSLVRFSMPDGHSSRGILIDRTGKIVSPLGLNIISCSGSYSVVCLGLNKWGVVDRDFNFIIKPEYWLILQQPATVYTAEESLKDAQTPPAWFYASKGERQTTEVLSREGKLICTLPPGTQFPFAPAIHYVDGAILCDIGWANEFSESYYVNLQGERIARPHSELSSSSSVSFHEIAPGRLLKTVKPEVCAQQ
jgi:hypothetical protein